MNPKQEVAETSVLNQEVGAYDEFHQLDCRLTDEWYPKRVIKWADPHSMLELGLGRGISTRLFAEHFDRYVVVEGSPEMFDRFQSKHSMENVEVEISYFENFTTDEKFTAIGMGFVLEHVDDPGLVLRRFSEFLAPGGRIFIAVPNCESLHRRLGHAAGLLDDLTQLSEVDTKLGHQRYFSCDSLRSLVEKEGLEVEWIEGILLKPVTTSQLEALNLDEPLLQALLKVGADYPELANSVLAAVRVHE